MVSRWLMGEFYRDIDDVIFDGIFYQPYFHEFSWDFMPKTGYLQHLMVDHIVLIKKTRGLWCQSALLTIWSFAWCLIFMGLPESPVGPLQFMDPNFGTKHDLVGGSATPLKNISQLGWLFPIYGKIKNVPNHQPAWFSCLIQPFFWLSMLISSDFRKKSLRCWPLGSGRKGWITTPIRSGPTLL